MIAIYIIYHYRFYYIEMNNSFLLYRTTCFIIGLIIEIAEMPLTFKLAKMRQNKEQTPDSTTNFTSLGKNKLMRL